MQRLQFGTWTNRAAVIACRWKQVILILLMAIKTWWRSGIYWLPWKIMLVHNISCPSNWCLVHVWCKFFQPWLISYHRRKLCDLWRLLLLLLSRWGELYLVNVTDVISDHDKNSTFNYFKTSVFEVYLLKKYCHCCWKLLIWTIETCNSKILNVALKDTVRQLSYVGYGHTSTSIEIKIILDMIVTSNFGNNFVLHPLNKIYIILRIFI